jgi:hypothetical protein
MGDPHMNPPDSEMWPDIQVVNGWVYRSGRYQMGFSLSPMWKPPPNDFEREAVAATQSNVRRMNFPPRLTSFLLEAFRHRTLASITIQRAEARWRIHLNLTVQDNDLEALIQVVMHLLGHAGLPYGSESAQAERINEIMVADPAFNPTDALYRWLEERIKQAVQEMFDHP